MKTSRMWMGLSLAAMMATGCAQEQESLIVLHAPAWSTPGECLVDGSNDTGMSSGILDVAVGTPYEMPVVLLNQLQGQTAMMTNNQIDNGELQLIAADVVLSMPQQQDVIDDIAGDNPGAVDFTVDISTISLGGQERQGFLIEVVPQATTVALASAFRGHPDLNEQSRPKLIAEVIFRARRTGNRVGKVGEIESRSFKYPIELCLGCLITCGACSDQARTETCVIARTSAIAGTPNPDAPLAPVVGGICGNAQDFFVAPSFCGDPNGM